MVTFGAHHPRIENFVARHADAWVLFVLFNILTCMFNLVLSSCMKDYMYGKYIHIWVSRCDRGCAPLRRNVPDVKCRSKSFVAAIQLTAWQQHLSIPFSFCLPVNAALTISTVAHAVQHRLPGQDTRDIHGAFLFNVIVATRNGLFVSTATVHDAAMIRPTNSNITRRRNTAT